MAVTRIKRLSGDVYLDGNLYPAQDNVYAIGGIVGNIFAWMCTTKMSTSGTGIALAKDIDHVTYTTYPNVVAAASCSLANLTYAKIKVAGTVKRILVYDDA